MPVVKNNARLRTKIRHGDSAARWHSNVSFLVIVFVTFLFVPRMALAAATVDAVTNNSGDASSFSHSHTVSGTNRLLVVDVGSGNGESVSSVTYAGQSLTLVQAITNSQGGKPRVEVWRLVNPPTGTNDVVVTMTTAEKVSIGAISYKGVDQTTPIDDTTAVQGTGSPVSVTVTSASSDLVQDVMASISAGAPTVGSGQTQQWNIEMGGTGASSNFSAGSTEPGAASVPMTWTISENKEWVTIGFNIAADVTAPTVSSFSPVDNATGVGVNANLVITFSEVVDRETGNITIKKTSDDTAFETIAVTDAKVTGTGTTTITVNPAGTFAGETEYYVQIAATAFDDPSGNSYAGISSTTAWSFTTADVTAPTVSSFSPVDNATGVGVNANLVITFSEVVDRETGNITIKKTSDDTAFETIAVTDAKVTGTGTTTITVNPAGTFAGETEYYVQIAATAFDDPSGNSYAGISSTTAWSFTTADVTVPTITSVTSTSSDGSYNAGDGINVTVNFFEAVTLSGGDLVVTLETGTTDRTVTISSISGATSASGTYTVQAGDQSGDLSVNSIGLSAGTLSDGADNGMTDFSIPAGQNLDDLKTIVVDGIAPTISSITSETDNGTYKIGDTINVQIKFSEAVIISGGNLVVTLETGTTDRVIEISDINITATVSGTYVIKSGDQSSDLSINSIALSAGTLTDVAGNGMSDFSIPVGQNLDDNKTFGVDGVVPTVSSVSPEDDELSVGIDANLVITFSEVVHVKSGSMIIRKTSDNVVVETIDVTSTKVTGTGTATITINPAKSFTSETGYYVIIDAKALDDAAGNSYAGISSSTTWNFVVEDVIAPVFDSTYPKTSNVGETSLNLSFKIDERGTAYFVVLSDGANAPSSAQVKAGVDASDVVLANNLRGSQTLIANTEANKTVTSLTSETAYDIYVVAEDDESTPNLQSSPTKIDVTTADVTPPSVIFLDPLDNALGVSINASLVIAFNEAVKAKSGNIRIKRSLDDTIFETISVTSPKVTGTGTGTITIDPAGSFAGETEYYVLIDASAFDDLSGNSYSGISSVAEWSFASSDVTSPTVEILSAESSPTNRSPIPISVEFESDVTGFQSSDVSVENGLITGGSFSGSGALYSFTVTPLADGLVTISIPANAAEDAAGNGNAAATQFRITYDSTAPTLIVSSTVSSPTNQSPIPIVVTFSETVSGFEESDVIIGNGSIASESFSGSASSYSFSIVPSEDATITVDISGDVAEDAAGNGNAAPTDFSIKYDRTSPTPSLSSTASSLTNVSRIPVTVTFSESVTGFAGTDVIISNGNIATGSFSGSGTSYSFSVIPSQDGTVVVDIPEDVAEDAAGNKNTAAIPYSVEYDGTAPSVEISSSLPSPINISPIPVSVSFSEIVSGFDSSDVAVGAGSITPGSFSGSGDSFSFTVAPAGDGTITVDIAEDAAQDGAGNGNTAATRFSITYNRAGFFLDSVSNLTTTEAGSTATFTVALSSQPSASVALPVASSNEIEGTVSPSVVVFTSDNWSVPNAITVTGADDDIDDGDVTFTIILGPAASSDPDYTDLNPADPLVTNIDDDEAGFIVNPVSGLITTEAGNTATFMVVLTSQPTTDVSFLKMTSSDATEGEVSPSVVSFTAGDWDNSQTVTITGLDDNLDDGDVSYSILTEAMVSTDPLYDGIDPNDVSVTNEDNDVAGFIIDPPTGLTTTESGSTATFAVSLTSQPLSNQVFVFLKNLDVTEGAIAPSVLSFDGNNWGNPQTVTITGVDDEEDDGDIDYTIVSEEAVSSGSDYGGLDPSDISVTNKDDDGPGVIIHPTSSLTTSEAGDTATFSVVLTSAPATELTVLSLSSSDTTEGTIVPSVLSFTSVDWNTPQIVTVAGVDDDQDDGDVTYTILTEAILSNDSDYNGMDPDDVQVTNVDDDGASVTVLPTTGLTTSEFGNTATFNVSLSLQPAADVTLSVSSSDETEGIVTPSVLLFTRSNWSTPQTVTVTGVDDGTDDGDVGYTVFTGAVHSNDQNYNGLNPDDVSVINKDDDGPGIMVHPLTGLTTTEAGSTATFTLVLTSQPTTDLTIISLYSSDPTEGTVAPSILSFRRNSWSTPQTVTVTGVDDELDDGDVAYTIVTDGALSDDADYAGLNPDDVSVINKDDDGPGLIVIPFSGLTTTEAGSTATFTVRLNSQPTSEVSLSLSSSDETEGTVTPSILSFTGNNWSESQTVTIMGVDDSIGDGDVVYTIVIEAASSEDPDYDGMEADDVSVTNEDDDEPGIRIVPVSGLTTTEAGSTATFTVVLTSQPATDLAFFEVSSSDETEGDVSPSVLSFTSTNWSMEQTVTVAGVDDDVDDGDIDYTIVTNAITSTDTIYDNLDPDDISVTNEDNDVAGFAVDPSRVETSEVGSDTSFLIVLTSEPTADVTLSLISSDETEGTVSPSSVTFTSDNWDTSQTVTVTGVHDEEDDSDVKYTVVIGDTITSDDENYSGLDPDSVWAVNRDPGAVIDVTVSLLQFGSVRRDSSKILSLNINSRGSVTLEVAATLTGEAFNTSATSFEVLPFDSYEVEVSFVPEEPIFYEETLTLVHSDSSRGNIEIALEGQGVKPTINVVERLDFGEVPVAQDSAAIVTVTNVGNDTLTVDSVYTTNPVFTVQLGGGGGLTSSLMSNLSAKERQGTDIGDIIVKNRGKHGIKSSPSGKKQVKSVSKATSKGVGIAVVQVPPDGSVDLAVSFLPTDRGDVEALMIIMSDDPDQTRTEIDLSGRGVAPLIAFSPTSFGFTTLQGEEEMSDLAIANTGDYPLGYTVEVDADAHAWLSISKESGELSGGSWDSLRVTAASGNLEGGFYRGRLLVTSNTGLGLSEKEDTVRVNLAVLSDALSISRADTTVPAGDPPSIILVDDEGDSLGVALDFDAGPGGTLSATAFRSSAPVDNTTTVSDPDSVVTNPVFGDFYWEIFDRVSGSGGDGFIVDVIFDYRHQVGVQNPEELRVGRRMNHAGPDVPWQIVGIDSTGVNTKMMTITAVNQSGFSQWTVISDSADNTLEDTQAPDITDITVPSSVDVGDSAFVWATMEDESRIEEVSLSYYRGGSSGFIEVPMTSRGSGVYEGFIPAGEVTLTGVAFVVHAVDMVGFSSNSDTFSVSVEFPTNALSTEIEGSAFPDGVPKDKWRLISVPAELDEPGVTDVFGDELNGKPTKKTWRMFEWKDSTWVGVTEMNVGTGYWIYQKVKTDVTLFSGSGNSNDLNGDILTIQPGWNLIGSPYPFPVKIDASRFFGPLTYGGSQGEGWSDVVDELLPWGGYVLYNDSTSAQTIDIRPLEGADSVAKMIDTPIDGWKLQLIAKGDTYSDVANYIGRIAGALEQRDRFDNPEPPYLDHYVSIAMERPDWSRSFGISTFTSDIRSQDETNGVWDIRLRVKGEKAPITLSGIMWGDFPDNVELVLLDLVSRETFNLLDQETRIVISNYNEELPYSFKVIAGTPEYVDRMVADVLESLPREISLAQNFPNPFNPFTRIQYALPKPLRVTLKVYNILGQEVVTLVEGWREAGFHDVVWDGKDRFGQTVSSGMYISALVTRERLITRKMVLIR